MIRHDATLLATDAFSKVKLPVSMMYGQDDRDRAIAIMTEVSRATGADLAFGSSKYERLLDLVGLGGPIPRVIRDSIFKAQQIRNVWAHRGGIADQRFVDACPNLGFNVDDRVNMTPETFLPLMHGMHMYGIVIANRYLESTGRPRLSAECKGYEGCLSEVP